MGRLIGLVVAGLLCALSVARANEAKTFTITINGVDYAIDEGETRTVKSKDGAELRLSLHKNEIGTFHGDFVSFQLTKGFSVTSSQLEADIKQHMLSTSRGTLVLVQEYADVDPRSLADFMLKQLAAPDLRDGGSLDKQSGKRASNAGVQLEGETAKLIIRRPGVSRTVHYEVETAGSSDRGIVALSRIDSDAGSDDQKVVDRFWDTLTVKF